MPDLPDAAVKAALIAYARALYDRPDLMVLSDERLVRTVLEAAAPAMAAAVAVKIAEHMDEHGPEGPEAGGKFPSARYSWRRHFRIAAQVASLAFTTEADLKRAAAEALSRGDFAACHLDEAGNPVAGQRED